MVKKIEEKNKEKKEREKKRQTPAQDMLCNISKTLMQK